MDAQYKKRHRLPASCSVCRKRKSKCDRARPVCGSCKKKSIAHLCFYENAKEGDILAQQSEVIMESLPMIQPLQPHQAQFQSSHQTPFQQPHQQLPQQIDQQNPLQLGQQHIFQQHIRVFPPTPMMDAQEPNKMQYHYPQQNGNSLPYHQENEIRNTYTHGVTNNEYLKPPIKPLNIHNNNDITLPRVSISQELPNTINFHSNESGINITKSELENKEPKSSPRLVTVCLGQNSKLLLDPEDTISIFKNASFSLNIQGNEWKTEGFVSFTGLTKRDPFLQIWRSFISDLLNSGKMAQFIKKEVADQRPRLKKRRRETETYLDDAEKDLNTEDDFMDCDSLLASKLQVSISENMPESEESFEEMTKILDRLQGYLSGSKFTIEFYGIVENVILKILPSKRTLSMLVDRYFMYVFPFSRIFDKESFMKSAKSLFADEFPSSESDYYSELSIETEADLHLIGILLIMARLGFLSSFHTNSEYDELRRDELISSDMYRFSGTRFKRVISICTSNCITAYSSFRYVQLLTLLFFYKRVDPSDALGLGGADGQILLGIIVRHALAIGLNRDPSFYINHDPICKRPALMVIWRSLWKYILHLDAHQSIGCGTVLNISSDVISDVKFPDLNCLTNEIRDTYIMNDDIAKGYRRIIRAMTNFQEEPKVIDILSQATHLEDIFSKFFGKEFFKDYICDTDLASIHPKNDIDLERCYSKVMKYCNFISLRTILSSMYSIIAINYENKNQPGPPLSAGVELFKIYTKSVVQLVFVISHTLENSVDFFGKNYDYILTAYNERCLSQAFVFLCSFFVRLIYHKRELMKQSDSPEVKARLEVIGNLYNLVILESDLFVGNFKDLSGRYSNSFRLTVISKFILQQCIADPNRFFENDYLKEEESVHKGVNLMEYLSNSELQYLCNLCEEFKSTKIKQNQILKAKRENRLNSNLNHSLSSSWQQSDSGMSNRSSSVQASPDSSSIYSIGIGSNKQEQMKMREDQLLQLFKFYGSTKIDDFEY